MGTPVLIIGESGTGKSASLRNLSDFALININGKPLPFKASKKDIAEYREDRYEKLLPAIKKAGEKYNVVVVDDFQYMLANEFMRRATEKGFGKFTEIGEHCWSLIRSIEQLPESVVVYFLSHEEESEQSGKVKMKTVGKLLDDKITVEGMFSIVLRTVASDQGFFFRVHNSGYDTVKTPMEMFEESEIGNDLSVVDKVIRQYYDISGEVEAEVVETSTQPAEKEEPGSNTKAQPEEKPKDTGNTESTDKDNEPEYSEKLQEIINVLGGEEEATKFLVSVHTIQDKLSELKPVQIDRLYQNLENLKKYKEANSGTS